MIMTDVNRRRPLASNKVGVANTMDVICGRGKAIANHPGNKRFRQIVQIYHKQYKMAATKIEKSVVVSCIIKAVRNDGGEFVRKDTTTGLMKKVSDRMAREKVGQGLRDALHTVYKSSAKAKNSKRKAKRRTVEKKQMMIQGILIDEEIASTFINLRKEISDDMSDADVEKKLTVANIRLLDELKRSMLKGGHVDDEYSSASSSWCNDDELMNFEYLLEFEF